MKGYIKSIIHLCPYNKPGGKNRYGNIWDIKT